MQYQQINDHGKISALNERISYIEQAHYSNTVYMLEAKTLGDKATFDRLNSENNQLDRQWQPLVEERDRILAELEKANQDRDEDIDDRELRG